jgi:hypothetical protein
MAIQALADLHWDLQADVIHQQPALMLHIINTHDQHPSSTPTINTW